ncbi:MAG: hypothetical protein HEQ38_19535 [Gemmatimonas sp.]|nr:hypothetical protein [Gemmatimonas sp.]
MAFPTARSLPAARPVAALFMMFSVTACASRGPAQISGGVVTAAVPASCGAPAAPTASLASAPATDPLVTFDTAWSIIARTHWDTTYNGVNWGAVRDELRPRAAAAKTRGELREVLSDMVSRLRQSHFSIIPQEVSDAAESPDRRESSGAASGALGFDVRLVEGQIVVSAVDTGGPAWQAGVRTGWIVSAVRGCPIDARVARLPESLEPRRRAFMAYQIASRALGGRERDTVLVGFRDAGNRDRALSLVYGPVQGTVVKFGNLPPTEAHLTWERVRRDGRTIGIIRFNIWMPVLAARFDAAVDSLRSADAIILDVRGNLGGVGAMSMGFAGHFLDSSYALGEMHQRSGTMKFLANPRRSDTQNRQVQPFSGPLALVVDPLSASTTEIFTGGLQTIQRGTVFGTQSAGQALPSVPERLPNGDILYHAIADFLGPTGKPVEGDGVIPDVVTPLLRRALLDGQDPALDAAIRWAARRAARPITP